MEITWWRLFVYLFLYLFIFSAIAKLSVQLFVHTDAHFENWSFSYSTLERGKTYIVSHSGINYELFRQIGTRTGPGRRTHWGSSWALQKVRLVDLRPPEFLQLLQPTAEHSLDAFVYLGKRCNLMLKCILYSSK